MSGDPKYRTRNAAYARWLTFFTSFASGVSPCAKREDHIKISFFPFGGFCQSHLRGGPLKSHRNRRSYCKSSQNKPCCLSTFHSTNFVVQDSITKRGLMSPRGNQTHSVGFKQLAFIAVSTMHTCANIVSIAHFF